MVLEVRQIMVKKLKIIMTIKQEVPIISLYGKNKKPSKESLKN